MLTTAPRCGKVNSENQKRKESFEMLVFNVGGDLITSEEFYNEGYYLFATAEELEDFFYEKRYQPYQCIPYYPNEHATLYAFNESNNHFEKVDDGLITAILNISKGGKQL